jgi:hypothetical protein
MSKKKTKEEFIKEATEKHEGKYDYDKVYYVNCDTKVCIICPEHGEFWQTPHKHLSGRGCHKCGHNATGNSKRSSKEDFIKKAHKVHGDKYDYSKVDYVNSKTKVCIICPEHGEFLQTPYNHTRGQGCPKCKGDKIRESKTLTKKEFIKKAREVHGDKYDYSKVNYVNSQTKVCIICPEHGEFWQIPNSHLRSRGCNKCGNEKISESISSSKEEFIKKARKVHSDKYDYSKVKYVGAHAKVCIICPEHGEFWQKPSDHTNGHGCPKCKGDKTRKRCTSTKKVFIKKARLKHGDKYNYSKVDYVNSDTKVCIICKKHGEFRQAPSNHLSGQGCPMCNLSHLERSVMNYLDEVGITYDYQKHFNWLGRQSVDFYLPDYKVGIECQGEQHFFPVDFANKGIEWACKEFDKTVSRDKRKKKLCEEKGVKLLYFGNVPNYDTFLGEVVHDDVQYLIDCLKEHNN